MSDQEGSLRREAGVAELAVDAYGLFGRERELLLGGPGDDVDDADKGWIAVLDVEDAVGADGDSGVNLVCRRRVVAPEDFLIGGDELDAELVSDEDVAVREHDAVGDFALAGGVVVGPGYLAVAEDEYAAVVGLAGVDEVMLSEGTGLGGGGDREGDGDEEWLKHGR